MADTVQRVEYFYVQVPNKAGEGARYLTALSEAGINLLAFTGMPVGPLRTQITLFPAEPSSMQEAARMAGLVLDGPHAALLVQGDY